MQIGEFQEAVGREFSARRNAMSSELSRLGARLAEPLHGETPPAVAVADTVHISPEARAAQFGRAGRGSPAAPLPSPAELVSVLQEVGSAQDPGTAREAVARLVGLIRRIAAALPAARPAAPARPGDAPATTLVRVVLAAPEPPSGTPDDGALPPAAKPAEVAGLVRELLPASPNPESADGPSAPTRPERAAVAILDALVRPNVDPAAPQAARRAAPGMSPGPARPGSPQTPFPSQVELVWSLPDAESAPRAGTAGDATTRLPGLPRQVAAAQPASDVAAPARPGDAPATALVQVVLGPLALPSGTTNGAPPPEAKLNQLAALVRELLAAFPDPGAAEVASPPTRSERAAAAVLVAIAHWNRGPDASPLALPAEPGTFPAALLGFLAEPGRAPKEGRKPVRKRPLKLEEEVPGDETPEPYVLDSRRA